ncbi:MAG TPA: SCO family protein [Acidimicrobiia bacterium]
MNRRLLTLAVLSVMLVLTACGTDVASDQLQGVVIENPSPKGQFVLTDTNGQPFDFARETEGKLTLLYFGYVNCPDICPVHLAQIAEVFSQHPEVARESEVVFVSVDPTRDTPEVIRDFLDNFDSDFVGLTGSPDELVAAQEAVGVPPARITGDGEDYVIDHAGWVIAYAPDGLNHSIYPFGTRQTEWTNDLQALLNLTESQS